MQRLAEYAEQYEIVLTARMQQQFSIYTELLLRWNEKINLTAITEPEDIIVKHYLDSLLLLRVIKLPAGASLIDVGTGAGFPGIPLKIARPDIRLTLLDSLGKRVRFLQELSIELGYKDMLCIHGRAEEVGRKPQFREQYDAATARAVSALPVLAEYCLPFVRVGGRFVALKGGAAQEELAQADSAIKLLGGGVPQLRYFDLPHEYRRSFVNIEKISQTSTRFPRASVKITKKPL